MALPVDFAALPVGFAALPDGFSAIPVDFAALPVGFAAATAPTDQIWLGSRLEIYTIICLKSVCLSVGRRSQTAGRNSCSIASGDVSN